MNNEKQKEYKKKWYQKNKKRIQEYQQRPEVKAKKKEYAQRPEVKERRRKYDQAWYQK
ncbi:hypothetical protein [Spiroplasma ixodetis]|uniref:Uncharacterized protein n=1 Tax=Spiroplasma ixodetis TaxID=2141 RepID=A0ABM8BZ17_9MOLU|nr:hypothetical protein [Spiroplasma ixodetis]BDT05133.1 hypothetical protein SHM_27790 [Spiroplasma ixodetis]